MIDLHSHTDRSDGTLTPAELVSAAVRAGVTTLAITDHDTFVGFDAALPIARAAGLDLICGIEVSTKFHGASVHLLGYFLHQPPSTELRDWLEFLLEQRRDRNVRLIARLQELGLDITLAEVEGMGRTLTARPHFARVLIDKGYVKTMQEAFDVYLDESAQGFVERHDVPMAEAIERIKAGGGISSLAHPVRVAKNHWGTLERYIDELARLGMDALEAHHSDHSPEDVSFYTSLAVRFGLGITGGSDFHGANKPHISLGTGLRNNLHLPPDLLPNLRALAHARAA
jgi:predicted metal-dependent phosphoesterase TrpH